MTLKSSDGFKSAKDWGQNRSSDGQKAPSDNSISITKRSALLVSSLQRGFHPSIAKELSMRLNALLVFLIFICSSEAFSQVRRTHRTHSPRPGHYHPVPHHGPSHHGPYRHHRTVPKLKCLAADLIKYNVIIHRFSYQAECREALQEAILTKKFCDGSSLYNLQGQLLARFTFNSQCKRAL